MGWSREEKEGKEGKEGRKGRKGRRKGAGREQERGRRKEEEKKKRTNKTEKAEKKTPNPQSTESEGRGFDGYECNRIPSLLMCCLCASPVLPCCSAQVAMGQRWRGWMDGRIDGRGSMLGATK